MWQACLTDGTIVTEGVSPWHEIPGKRKPWVRLCKHMEDKGLSIQWLRVDAGIHGTFCLSTYDRVSMSYLIEGEWDGSVINSKTWLVVTGHHHGKNARSYKLSVDNPSIYEISDGPDFEPLVGSPLRSKGWYA